jgi:hypothetical protein
MLLFAFFVVEANLSLFSKLETRFYSQTKIAEKLRQLDQSEEDLDSYISDVLSVLGDYAQKPEVFSYYEHNPSEKSVTARRNVTENLFKQLPSLSGIRIIDVNGRNIHYSSFDETDVLKQNGLTKIYKNYSDIIKDCDEIDFSFLKTEANDKPKLLIDSERNRMIISQPFFWFEKYQGGNIVFYFDFISLRQTFVDIFYMEEFRIFSDSDYNGGIVLGLPKTYEREFKESILENWAEKKKYSENQYPKIILSSTDGNFWTLLTAAKSKYFKVSGVWYKSSFELSKDLIRLIYVCVFITIFLVVYLLFSLSRDPISTAKKKIRNIQLGIIQEYIAQKKEVDWNRIVEQIQFRKKEILESLKKDLLKKSGKNREEIEQLLENGWNDIMHLFDAKNSTPGFSMDELRRTIEDVLKNVKIPVTAVPAAAPVSVQSVMSVPESPADIEEVSELETADPVETLDEPASDVEELEEIDEAEDVEEIEEAEAEGEQEVESEPVEELETLEGDGESVEELEAVEGDAEPVEELETLEGDAEAVGELEAVEGEPEPVAELETLEGDAESVEELEEAELVDDDIEEAEALDDVEELAELDELSHEEAVALAAAARLSETIEELPEYDEFSADNDDPVEEKKDTFYSVDNLFPEKHEYFEDVDSFIRSDRFASVDDLFAEEIALGAGVENRVKHSSNIMDFKVTKISEIYDNLSVLEEAKVPETKPYFSMTEFAKNDREIKELQSAEPDTQVIKENGGVFQISENMDFSNPECNKDFKALVDSVLRK